MEPTKSRCEYQGRWSAHVEFEPGSVPDLPWSWTKTGKTFRPARVVFNFYTTVHDTGMAKLQPEAGSGFMKYAAGQVRWTGGSLTGPAVLKSGALGQSHTENLYGTLDAAPQWYQDMVIKYLRELGL